MMLKYYPMDIVKKNGSIVYKLRDYDLFITEHRSMDGKYFQLSTKEILNVIEYCGVLDKVKNIEIIHTMLPHVQAYVAFQMKAGQESFTGKMVLRRAVKESHRAGAFGIKDERKVALFVLCHEIGHITGIDDEQKADEYGAKKALELWGKMIKP